MNTSASKGRISKLLLVCTMLTLSVGVQAQQWTYKKDKEELTDKVYSFAAGFAFDYQYNNDFTVSFICDERKVRFDIDADRLLASKGDPFKFSYRVDDRPARTVTMTTFSNNGQGGFLRESVTPVAQDFLGGKSVFVRAVTWDNDYLEARVSLAGADSAIKKVFADCNSSLERANPSASTEYTISQFNSDFAKLPPGDQKRLLKQIEPLLKQASK